MANMPMIAMRVMVSSALQLVSLTTVRSPSRGDFGHVADVILRSIVSGQGSGLRTRSCRCVHKYRVIG